MPDDFDSTKGLRVKPPEKPVGGKKCLLTIAIDKYDGSNGYGRLQCPVDNAKKITEELVRSYGFDDVISIKDEECTKGGITYAIEEARKRAGKNGQLVVYFSGHGAAVGDDGYWIPFDSREEIVDNCSVFNILNELVGRCAQVLLLVDCCYSGTVVDATYPVALFKKELLQKSAFYVVTAGRNYEEVKDKSIFFETLHTVLRYETVRSFIELVAQLEERYKKLRGLQKPTSLYTVDYSGQTFLLQRDNCVSYDLAKSFLELNYKDQSLELTGVAVFNMTYLRGSSNCGHYLFLHRYFEKNNKSISIIADSHEYKISFGGECNSSGINIWEQLAISFDLDPNKADSELIIETFMNVLMDKNVMITATIKGSCTEGDLEAAFKDFWREIYLYSTTNKEKIRQYSNRVYFFIWDMRGKAEGIGDIVTKAKFEPHVRSSCAKLLALPVIGDVKHDDFYDWHDAALNKYESLIAEKKFRDLDFSEVQPPFTVMNVIAQIEELCGCSMAFSKLFSSNKFPFNE